VGFLPLNPSLLPISYISYCKCSSIVEARLMRFWEARNMKRQGDLVDVNVSLFSFFLRATIMQATINSSRLPRFRSRLTAGSMYTISGFDVARCAQSFRLSDSPLMIRFNDLTSFDEITEPVSPLPEEGFRFRNQTESFETAEGAFGCFDGVMTKLHNLRAAEAGQMLAAEGVNPEDVTMPLFITDMEGKTLTLITSLHTIRHSKSHTSSLNMSVFQYLTMSSMKETMVMMPICRTVTNFLTRLKLENAVVMEIRMLRKTLLLLRQRRGPTGPLMRPRKPLLLEMELP
ncbi:hypothetical protein HID58_055868, partial [Brassica napus]